MDTLPPHATILVYALAPLTDTRVEEQIQAIRNHKNNHNEGLATTIGRFDWTISNKYYTAHVGFKVITEEEELFEGDEPAIIILTSRSNTPSELLSPLLSKLSKRTNEFEIALLLSCPSPSTSIDEDAWEDLAMNNGFEWVDMISLSAHQDEEMIEEGGGGGEESGVGRVVDALHAHLWEGMVVKKQEPRKELLERELTEEEAEENSLGAPPLPSPRPFIPTVLEFPSTFLPSIPRPTITSTPSTMTGITTDANISFEDDFSPFVVPTVSTSTFPILAPSSTVTSTSPSAHFPAPSVQPISDPINSLTTALSSTSIVSLPTPISSVLEAESSEIGSGNEVEEGEEGEEGEEDLAILLEKLMEFKKSQEGLGLEERRARVEELMKGMNLGEW